LLVIQTVADSPVTATVLAVRYRRPGQADGSPTLAHLWEHLLYRTAPGGAPGGLLLRAESLGAQSRAYVSPATMLLGEVVPAEHGLESLDLELERLRGVPSDAGDLAIEKQSVGREIAQASSWPEEVARRRLLARLGVDAWVEGDAEKLETLGVKELKEQLARLSPESDLVIAIVGPQTESEVIEHVRSLPPLAGPAGQQRSAGGEAPVGQAPAAKLPAGELPAGELPAGEVAAGELPAGEAPAGELPAGEAPAGEIAAGSETAAARRLVASAAGYRQESFFLRLPGMGESDRRLARLLLREMLGPEASVELVREEGSLYRLDLSPPPASARELARELARAHRKQGLEARLRRDWLDSYEQPLDRAEMMALQSLQGVPFSALPGPQQVQGACDRVLGLLTAALQSAPSLLLEPAGGSVEQQGLFPFQGVARAPSAAGGRLGRETLPNGLSVAWQELDSWPIVAVSGFFRLHRPLTPSQCEALERKLEARTTVPLDYEIRPEALLFHQWCPASELASALASSAKEIRALSESGEVLVEQGQKRPASPLQEFFLPAAAPAGQPVSGKALLWPQTGELVLVGQIDPVVLDRGLRPAWNGWFRDNPPPPYAARSQARPAGPASETVKLPPGSAPTLLVGVWGPNRATTDFLPFNLALQTLAGRPTSNLLARQLRDVEGLVETVSVFPLSGSEQAGQRQLWLLALRPREGTSGQLLAARVLARLEALTREPLPEAELERTRMYLKGALKVSTATPRGRATVLANSELYRFSEQYSIDYAGLYDRIKPAQVQAVCAKYLAQQPPRWLLFEPETSPAAPSETAPR
jgi:predicted Zn-dependent peptidase